MIILIPISIISFITGCIIFGLIMVIIAVFCTKSYVKNIKLYNKYKLINSQIEKLEREDKIDIIFRNCDDWLMFATEEEIADLRKIFSEMKMLDTSKYQLEFILCRAKKL